MLARGNPSGVFEFREGTVGRRQLWGGNQRIRSTGSGGKWGVFSPQCLINVKLGV